MLESHSEFSLNQWISKFGRIYGGRHDKHTTEYMTSRLVEEIAELVDPMESQDRDRIGPDLADVFSWICSIAFKLKIDLSRLAWEKYGKNAPRPTWARDSVKTLISPADYSEPDTLPEWQEFISRLYRAENSRLTPMNALVAMMKDVGDLAMNQRKREKQEQVTSKLAAVLAWTLTIAELLKLDLADVVYRKYDDHCPVCKQEICDTDVCHPLSTLFVSFGSRVSDEEKYVILDVAAKYGFKSLVDSSTELRSTSDLSDSLDLINRSDAACILFSDSELGVVPTSEYRQAFEALACYSVLSRGNVWIFTKNDKVNTGFGSYLKRTLENEKPAILQYSDPSHLNVLFDSSLKDLMDKRSKTMMAAWNTGS